MKIAPSMKPRASLSVSQATAVAAVVLRGVMILVLEVAVVAGGVAANKSIRDILTVASREEKFEPIFPSYDLCGDNLSLIHI